MRIDPLQYSKIPTAVSRVQRSRPYVDYKFQEEHDALLHTGADKLDDRKAAAEAAQAITALIEQLSILRRTITQGTVFYQRKPMTSSQVRTSLAAAFKRDLEACLHLFDEHPALRRSWKQMLSDSAASSTSDPFALNGPATAVRNVIDGIESTPVSLLLEPKLLARILGSTRYSYSPHTRLQLYSTTKHSLSLLVKRQG